MAPSPADTSAALRSLPEKKESLRKVFSDLEEHRSLITRCSGGWKELETHLSEIHDALEQRFAEIVDKESKFGARMKELQEALDKRESVIESREQASLVRVQEQKDAAIAAIREQKRKWIEERQLLQSQSPAKPDPDSGESKPKQKDIKFQKDEAGKPKSGGKEKDDLTGNVKESSLKNNHDPGVKKSSKEIASTKSNQKEGANSKLKKGKDNSSTVSQKKEEASKLDDVVGSDEGSISKSEEEKERKPGTVVATDSKHDNVSEEQSEEAVGKQGSAEENVDDVEDCPEAMEVGDDDAAKSGDDDGSDEEEKEGSHKKVEDSESAVKVRPELISFCEKMDGPGLHSCLNSQKKSLKFLRKELPIAMKCAANPSQLVVQVVKEYLSGSDSAQARTFASRRSCLALLDSLAFVLDGERKTGNEVSDEVKEEAKKVADLWKPKLNPKGSDQSAQVDTHSFLLLVATFGLASSFSENELCDLVIPIAFRRQIAKLLRKLGLAHKAPGLFQRFFSQLICGFFFISS